MTIGDFATTTVDGTFALTYLVANTIMNLTTQEAQVACFRNAAAHLEPGGCFVIEVGVPGLQRLPPSLLQVPALRFNHPFKSERKIGLHEPFPDPGDPASRQKDLGRGWPLFEESARAFPD